MDEAEVVKLMTAWKDEILKLRNDYHVDITLMKNVKDEIIAREKRTPWLKYGIWLAISICILATILVVVFRPDLCKINLDFRNGFAIERCK